MTREVEARLRLSAVDKSAPGFNSIKNRIRDVERATKALDRGQVGARQAKLIDRQTMALRAAEGAALGYGKAIGAAAIVGGLAAAAKSAMNFEDALSAIGRKGNISGAQLAKVGEDIKSLATSGEVATSIDEVASAFERAAAAGLPLEEWSEFAKVSAKAADAFEMTAEDVGNAAAGFKVSLGVGTKDVERYFDLINNLADSGISSEKDIIDFVDRAGASLKTFGESKEQIAAIGASLLNLKMPSDVAARMMGTLSTKLLAPGSEGAWNAYEKIVGSVPEFQKLLKTNPNRALDDFFERISKMDKFKAADLLTSFLGQGFSDEVMRAANGLAEIRRNMALAEGDSWVGSLDRSYQSKLKQTSSQLKMFKTELTKLAIDIGNIGLPAFTGGLASAREIVGEIDEGMKNFGSMIDAGAYERAKESIGGVVEAIGQLIQTNPNESEIARFFREAADAANDITNAINRVQGMFNKAKDSPAGRLAAGDKEGFAKRVGTTVDPVTGRINKVPMKGGLFPGLTRRLGEATDSPTEMRPDYRKDWPEGRIVPRHPVVPYRMSEVAASRNATNDATLGPVRNTGLPPLPNAAPRISPGFDPARFGDGSAMEGGADRLRAALEAGGQAAGGSVTDGGQAAAQAIAAVFGPGAALIEGAIRSALAQGVKVSTPRSMQGPPMPAQRNLGVTMPDAGTPGG